MHKHTGFTLIEVLITLLIISFGLLALGQFDARLMSDSAHAKRKTEAIHLAKDKIDQYRNFNGAALLGSGFAAISSGEDVVESRYTGAEAPMTRYNRTWTVTTLGSNTKQLEVTVSWGGKSTEAAEDTSVTLKTLLVNTPPELASALFIDRTPLMAPGASSGGTGSDGSGTGDAGTGDDGSGDSGDTGGDDGTDPSSGDPLYPEPATCACKRTSNSGNAKSQSADAACTDTCCKAQMPESTPKDGYFAAYCPI